MTPNPITQWLELGKSSLEMFNQLGEAGSAGMKDAGSQLPNSQAQLAQLMKSTMDLSKEINDLQISATIKSLQAQLDALNPSVTSTALRDLLDVHFGFFSNLSNQWKTALEKVAERTNTCIDDLRKAQTKDDVLGVVALFMKDLSNRLREDAEHSGTLINSASAAANVLVDRALDEMIGPRGEPESAA